MKHFTLLVALFVACAPVAAPVPDPEPSIAGVRFEATSTSGEVVLTLHNGTDAPIGFNLCSSRLERREGTVWTHIPTGEMCTMEIRSLPAGETARFEKTLPAKLAGGVYRYTTIVDLPNDERLVLATEPFSRP